MSELLLRLRRVKESGLSTPTQQAAPEYDEKSKTFSTGKRSHNSKGVALEGEPKLISRRECAHLLAYRWSFWKKWSVLSVIFILQVSMNFNAAVYGNANAGIAEEFGVSAQAARTGQATFLIAYAFGSELWAPWSEELGRWPILQLSLFFVNIFQLPVALAPNFASVVIGRVLGGLSSAGGSVTLGLIADMYSVNTQGHAVNYIVLSSVGGSVVGPFIGAFIEANLPWQWVFWVSLIFGAAVQALHFFFVPESSPEILMDREARRQREELGRNVWGPGEVKEAMNLKECMHIWARPFIMFATEPIVLCLSLLSGFSDALIFTFIEAFTPVYGQYGFSTVQLGLAFLPLLVGYVMAYFFFIPFIRRDIALRKQHPGNIEPEGRLLGLLYTAPLLCLGLFGFAWTSLGPQHSPPIPWIAPMIFSALIGVANAAIYMATIDYMIAAYGPYAASATGGNALARDGLSGIAAYYSTPFYSYFKEPNTLSYPSTILACIAFLFTIPIYIFFWKGRQIRSASKFAQTLATSGKISQSDAPEPSESSTDQDPEKQGTEGDSEQGSQLQAIDGGTSSADSSEITVHESLNAGEHTR